MKSRAAVAFEKSKPLTITNVELDGPKAGEVLIRHGLHQVAVHKQSEGRRLRIIVKVPLLSPELSARWLRLFTDVDLTTARTLVDFWPIRFDRRLGDPRVLVENALAVAASAPWN